VADLKLVGAVAIKVRPDAGGFREDTQKQIKKELRDVKAKVEVEAELNEGKVEQDAEKLEKKLEGKTVTWNVKLDHDSVRAAQKQFDSMLAPTKKIEFDLNDEGSIKQAQKDLEDLAKKAKVRITYAQDEKGYNEVLAKIAEIRRQKLEKTINFKTSKKKLDELEKEMKLNIAKLGGDEVEIKARSTIKFEYDENRAALEETLAKIDAELAKFKDQTFYVSADEASLIAARTAVKEAIDNLPVKFRYDNNKAGLEKAIKEIDAELDKVRTKLEIEALLDEESLLAARAKLVADLKDVQETIEISYNHDRASMQKVLDEIDKAMASIDEVKIEVGVNPFELAWRRADIEAAMAKIPVTFEYDRNVAGLKKAIAEIDAELSKHGKFKLEATLDPLNLAFAKARLEEELGEQKVHIEYEEGDLSSLKAARARILALLPIEHKLHITSELNEASLLRALAEVDAMIKAATPEVKVKVKPEVSHPDYLKALLAIKTLAKNQTVGIFVKLNNASVLLAAAKLTGLRAASRWTEAFARSIGTLDRNLPILAAAVVGLNTLTSGVISLSASAFSLGNDLGMVIRMAALLAPAMILGFAAVKTVMQGVFKDFGAAVNGDDKAIEKLTESGKKAAANMRVIFQDIRETVSKNFWAEASDNMLKFTETALPAVRDGMANLATSMGGVFGSIVDATSRFAQEDGFLVFFTNLIRGFDNVRDGMGPFMSAFLNLAALGSTIFPRMGKAFEVMSGKFDAWVTGLAADGTFNRWIDQGVQGIKDLWGAGVSLIGVWENIGQAAQGAGALTLHSFAQMMAKLEDVTNGYRFQTNLSRIFQGAREASDTFHAALGKLGPAMDVFSVTMGNALANSGKALAAFIGVLGDVLSSSGLDRGLTAFLGGVKTMFEELRPAAAPLSEILQTFGELLGAVARDSGPLFRNLFQQLATVFSAAFTALEPFLPALIQIGTSIINIVGPAMTDIAETLIPAFASGLQDLGDGMIPIIKFLSDIAVGAAGWISSMPLPWVAAIATGILTLGSAMSFAAGVLPVVNAALKIFGSTAALTGLQMQLMIPVVGIALAAITGLAIGGIAQLATGMKSGTPYANEYATALREDAKAAAELGHAVDDAQKKLTIKKLFDTGAYDKAIQLGIGVGTLTKAVLEGGDAAEEVKGKIAGFNKVYDENFEASKNANKGATTWSGTIASTLTPAMLENRDAANALNGIFGDVTGSLKEGQHELDVTGEASKAMGIAAEGAGGNVNFLTEALKKSNVQFGVAASATDVLTDAFSSSSAKVDAMRKTFDLLIGKDAKQSAAETLGAYVSGFDDLKESVTPLAGKMQELGDAVYGENGFLNVAGGNKAVMQVNQALVDEVNNVWVGAKAAYDAAIKQGKNATDAFAEAQTFINDHKGDYDALAEASGVSAAAVQGQWDAVFGHPWVLQVSLQGATEAAAKAQAMIVAIKGNFDGQKFMAWLDANPDMALAAVSDADTVARAFVNSEWKARLEALPQPAIDAIHGLKGLTKEEWNEGDFSAIMRVAKDIPGLAEALQAIRNGAAGDYEAIMRAIADHISIAEARRQLDAEAYTRTVLFKAIADRSELSDLDGAEVSGTGRFGTSANGSILRSVRSTADLFKGLFPAGVSYYANGGIERHVAQIASGRGPVRIWGERETQGEAYIPYAQSKRPRSLAILTQVAKDFGYELSKASEFANGGLAGHTGPTTTNNASVTIGTLVTTDADAAVRKIRISQQDALAVAGITLNGA
jgi:hypothetical protein